MNNILLSEKESSEIVAKLLDAANAASNEEQFKIKAEFLLQDICLKHNIFWNSYTYDRVFQNRNRRVDSVHGSTIIEYESPKSFVGIENAKLLHARNQAEEYAELLSEEEGRDLNEYSLVVWDGETISFGSFHCGRPIWENPQIFDDLCINRLITLIAIGGKPLVSPLLLKQFVGPETDIGRNLLPLLFQVTCKAKNSKSTTRTKLIFAEWARLFGQVDGTESERLVKHLRSISLNHNIDYGSEPQAYIFSLNTYIAVVAKICSFFALASQANEPIEIPTNPREFLKNIESGEYFRGFGIENMAISDFFSWYLGDEASDKIIESFGLLIDRLKAINFDITYKNSRSVRDLFKGLYMEFTPSSMRHALGEYYTPDWLATHVVGKADWNWEHSLLDPTCGSGTFILEGLRRRLEKSSLDATSHELLNGLWGFDLNPLAVLATKASIIVFLSGKFTSTKPQLLPIFLADAINTADPVNGIFTHTILTEKGKKSFAIPVKLAESPEFFMVMDYLRVCIDTELDEETILLALQSMSLSIKNLIKTERDALKQTIKDLTELHKNHWNGIWCLILFDRIKAGCVREVDLVAGNPPWVKWSHLPRAYAEFIKPICDRMKIFSDDVWVGGIQSDISTVVTYHALERFVKKGGKLAFLITGTVFKNESSQGFRRWKLYKEDVEEPISVEVVEDYSNIRPFDGVTNCPTLLLIHRNNEKTKYPIPYRTYSVAQEGSIKFKSSSYTDFFAIPVPGTDSGPWLVGSKSDLKMWSKLFRVEGESHYRARKGVTTDINGLFFVTAELINNTNLVRIKNDPKNGRNREIIQKIAFVEKDDVFPLLRGRNIERFKCNIPSNQFILIPQRGMFGDETLPMTRPRLFKFFCEFKDVLQKRSSYRRFQKNKAFWSVWTVGEYTFSPWKVLWKEMSGNGFVAAYAGTANLGNERKLIIPDHKIYFIPVDTEDEAAYLCAFLNSNSVTGAINAYAASLSLGTSIVEYFNIPKFNASNATMINLANMAKKFHAGMLVSKKEEKEIDELVKSLIY